MGYNRCLLLLLYISLSFIIVSLCLLHTKQKYSVSHVIKYESEKKKMCSSIILMRIITIL